MTLFFSKFVSQCCTVDYSVNKQLYCMCWCSPTPAGPVVWLGPQPEWCGGRAAGGSWAPRFRCGQSHWYHCCSHYSAGSFGWSHTWGECCSSLFQTLRTSYTCQGEEVGLKCYLSFSYPSFYFCIESRTKKSQLRERMVSFIHSHFFLCRLTSLNSAVPRRERRMYPKQPPQVAWFLHICHKRQHHIHRAATRPLPDTTHTALTQRPGSTVKRSQGCVYWRMVQLILYN